MGLVESSKRIELPNEGATLNLGAQLAGEINEGIVFLKGELGVGKTTLVRGYLRALGYEGAVKSPTYTLVEPYELAGIPLAHLDLYRVSDPVELEYIGLEEIFEESSLAFIEWPERGNGYLPSPDLVVTLSLEAQTRIASLEPR